MALMSLFTLSWVSPPDGMRAEELRAMFASLAMTTGAGRPTLLEDPKTGSARHSIPVPLDLRLRPQRGSRS